MPGPDRLVVRSSLLKKIRVTNTVSLNRDYKQGATITIKTLERKWTEIIKEEVVFNRTLPKDIKH